MRNLLIFDAADEFILSTSLDQLDSREAGEQYSKILKQKMDAHHAARFIVGYWVKHAFGGVAIAKCD